MDYGTLGRTGLKVSRIAFGAGPIGYLGASGEQAGQVLNLLLDRGVNLIDTAAAYLGSEELIGRAVGHRRGDFVLLSKCGRKVEGIEGEDWSAKVVTATVDRSLRRLGTDHLDIMLLHSCTREVLEKGEALGALLRAREAGKIRFAGYSGDNDAAAFAVGLPGVDVLMCSVNLCDQVNLEGAVPAAAKAGAGVIAKRPVANGAWKPAEAQQGIYQDYVKPYSERFAAMGLDPRELGFEGEDPWMEIALRFTLAQPGVDVVSIGTTRPANAEANLRLLEKGPLDPAAAERIRAAFSKARAHASTPWPGLT
ncbi:MAG: aldo/keto reductase [Holophaga sp.]|nr:aldo/keto reductase [Holophaga sp.]